MLDIEIRDISRRFAPAGRRGGEDVLAVDGVNLSIKAGEIFFLLGPSGCGKTTLLRMLAGFVEPTAGRILFNGRDVTEIPAEKRNLAMVFQNYALWPHMTVEANVGFAGRIAKRSRRRQRETVDRMLETVGMTDRRHHRPGQLSGGQQQRVALARALAGEPKALLLDEPLSNLDARLRVRMREEIRRIVTDAGTTAVYVTHDQEEALSMADRIAVMVDGRVAQVGTPAEIYHRPATRFVADFLGEANFLPATVTGREGDCVLLESPCGPIRAWTDRTLDSGAEVTCCIRPERIRLGSADRATNRIEVRCIGRTHLGATRRYDLVAGGEYRLAAITLTATTPAAEEGPVEASFAAEDVVVLD